MTEHHITLACDLPERDRWFLTAHAQCECSRVLLEQLEHRSSLQTYYHAQTAVLLFAQALESFFKARLVLGGVEFKKIHTLGELYDDFRKAHPDLAFETSDVTALVYDDRPGSIRQFLCYPTDRHGNLWDDACPGGYRVQEWLERVTLYGNEFKRLEREMRKAEVASNGQESTETHS